MGMYCGAIVVLPGGLLGQTSVPGLAGKLKWRPEFACQVDSRAVLIRPFSLAKPVFVQQTFTTELFWSQSGPVMAASSSSTVPVASGSSNPTSSAIGCCSNSPLHAGRSPTIQHAVTVRLSVCFLGYMLHVLLVSLPS